ncbi:MAG: hypothetical protein D6813_08160 [Calditrichaeota bacterium]|nr:MAG: hypothetical protein D6813_08160 [Calditrichota bacterium]
MKIEWAIFYTIFLIFLININDSKAQGCFECHGDPDFVVENNEGVEISLYVDSLAYSQSIHGDFACEDCHTDIEEIPHAENLKKVDCASCHDDVLEEYKQSIHARALEQGSPDAPSCSDCHGKHDILPSSDPNSRTHPLNLASTCARCHADPKIVKKYNIPIPNPLKAYLKSVHGLALLSERNFKAATCNSCHGSHDIRAMDDPESPIYWKNVPGTCGKCHSEINQQYTISVHWEAAQKGIREAPVCTDCHGEHEVKSPRDPTSPVHPLRVSEETCGRCHASERITEKFGLPEARVATFEESYHGLAIKGGSLTAANCASCHGIHNILPSSDPRSTIYPANLQKTCGSCHPKASRHFAEGPIHLTTSSTPGRIVNYVRKFYIWLIVIVISGMMLHNMADFIKRTQRKIQSRKKE